MVKLSPVGTRIWAGSRAWRPERGGHSNLGRRPSPRRDATAREAGVGAAPKDSSRPQPRVRTPAPCSPLSPTLAIRSVCPKVNSCRRQGCRFETLRLLLALRAVSTSGNLFCWSQSAVIAEVFGSLASNRRRACTVPGIPPGLGDSALPRAPTPQLFTCCLRSLTGCPPPVPAPSSAELSSPSSPPSECRLRESGSRVHLISASALGLTPASETTREERLNPEGPGLLLRNSSRPPSFLSEPGCPSRPGGGSGRSGPPRPVGGGEHHGGLLLPVSGGEGVAAHQRRDRAAASPGQEGRAPGAQAAAAG